MDDNKFWLAVWAIVAAAVIGVAGAVTYADAHQRETVLKAIEGGADPLTARCAIGGHGPSSAGICAIVAARNVPLP